MEVRKDYFTIDSHFSYIDIRSKENICDSRLQYLSRNVIYISVKSDYPLAKIANFISFYI